MDALLETSMSFALLLAVFLPLERLFPAHRQRVLRAEWGTDLLFFLGQYLVWTAPVVAVLVYVHGWLEHAPLASLREFAGGLPFAAQFVIAFFLSDLSIYWAHRASHRSRFLWRFHRVHHTAPHVDWLAAHREHPLDNLYTRLIENVPLIVLGFPLASIAGFAMFRGLWAIYIHSNVSLTPGPLARVLGSPRLHHWHHAIERGGDVNYANLSPLMDLLFGTYHDPGHFPERYGAGEPGSHAYVTQIVEPMVPARLGARVRHLLDGVLAFARSAWMRSMRVRNSSKLASPGACSSPASAHSRA